MGVVHSNALLHQHREIFLYVHNAGHVCVCVCLVSWVGQELNKDTQKRLGAVNIQR